jgi:hemerythrin-like domain-containing protein
MVEDRIEQMSQEIERLQRLDMRMNQEMVKKPYKYIDKVKAAIDKEQKEIVSIVSKNNDKYVAKMGQLDHKISKVLVDTETLLDQYRKKIGDINKNMESTKRYRAETDRIVENLESRIIKCMETCDHNHTKTT